MSQPTAAAAARAGMASWLEAFNTKDRVAFARLYDPGVVYASAHSPLRQGAAAVIESFEGALDDPDARIEFAEEAVIAGADLALITGTFRIGAARPDGSVVPASTGRVALAFRRASDGRWLLVFDMDNEPPDTM